MVSSFVELPATLHLDMPDGETIPYVLADDTLDESGRLVTLTGPCPRCFMMARDLALPLSQVLSRTRLMFRLPRQHVRCDQHGRLTVNEATVLRHVGCYEGVVFRGAWVECRRGQRVQR